MEPVPVALRVPVALTDCVTERVWFWERVCEGVAAQRTLKALTEMPR